MFAEKFLQLLEKGGSALQSELFRLLTQDFLKARQSLVAAEKSLNWQAVGDTTHVLLSLAGTVGATHLYDKAHALNAQAMAQIDGDAFVPSLEDLVRELDAVIQMIADYPRADFTATSLK